MAKQTITAVFDTRDHAESAALSLRQVGIPTADVALSSEDARDELGAGTGLTAAPKKTGFMASLENMFGGYEDRDTYAEGVRRGGTLLTAHVDDSYVDRAVSLLEQHGAVDLDEREETWRGEGWTAGRSGGAMAATGVAGAGAVGLAMTSATSAPTVTTTETRMAAPVAKTTVPTSARTGTIAGEDVIQVVEERLDVGKRAVSRGKVRLHSYVVENQVAEDITLRDETVTVDRRAVDRPVAALGADVFQERTIEMEEVDEEAVVAKSARVVEEIGIRKDAIDRVETVRDTVRSTKVDIEDGRTAGTAAAAAGTTASFLSRLVKDLEVVGSDGVHVGIVDRVEGAMMKLKRKDAAADGQHHLLPTDLVRSVDGKAMLSIAAAEAMRRWTAV